MTKLKIGDLEWIERYITPYISKYQCPICITEIRRILTQGPNSVTNKRFCKNCGRQVWIVCECGANLRYDMDVCPKCNIPNPIYLGDPNILANWIDNELPHRM